MTPPPHNESSTPRPNSTLAEVRYSLPEMLEELKAERSTGTFAMEKLDQFEIGKLFKAKASPRRGKSKK
jgi:hypothetical protein